MSTPDIDDIIIQDYNESYQNFLDRKALTINLLNNNDINHITALTYGRFLMNKILLGITYDKEIENILLTLKY